MKGKTVTMNDFIEWLEKMRDLRGQERIILNREIELFNMILSQLKKQIEGM